MSRTLVGGSSQYLVVAATPITAAPLSVACRFRPSAANGTLFAIGDKDVTNEQWRLRFNASSQAIWTAQTSAGEASATYTGATLSNGTWYSMVGVESSATSRVVYLDNGVSGANTTSRAPAGADNIYIGRQFGSGSPNYLSGDIAEMGIWSVALTAADVAQLTAGYSPLMVRPDALVFYLPAVRDADQDIIGGLSFTPTNTPTVGTHPRVYYPTRAYYPQPAAAVAATGHSLVISDGMSNRIFGGFIVR